MVLAFIDWGNVIGGAIGVIPATVAAVAALRIHGQVKTPSGKSIGEVAEYAHDTAIANNLLLSNKNGPVKPASKDELHDNAQSPPLIPTDSKPNLKEA